MKPTLSYSKNHPVFSIFVTSVFGISGFCIFRNYCTVVKIVACVKIVSNSQLYMLILKIVGWVWGGSHFVCEYSPESHTDIMMCEVYVMHGVTHTTMVRLLLLFNSSSLSGFTPSDMFFLFCVQLIKVIGAGG